MNQDPGSRAEKIEVLVGDFIAEHAAIEACAIDRDENLLNSGLIDSVGMMRLIALLEEELGVSVPPQDLVPENFRTIRVMAAYLSGLGEG